MIRLTDDDITVIVLTNFADGAPETASTDEGLPTGL